MKKAALLSAILATALSSRSVTAQMAVPTVRNVKPLVVGAGQTAAIEIRGENLDGASAIVFEDLDARVEAVEPSGDRVKARIVVPKDIAPGLRSFRVITPRGLSNAGSFVVGRPIPSIVETGANHGFKTAQRVANPVTVEGNLANGDEVDVFAIEMKAGQTLVAEAFAARAGSGLDALVTIFSPDGRELAADDDLFGRDAAAWVHVPVSGRYYVQIQDANGRNRDGATEGQTTRPYLLTIGEVPLVISAYPSGGARGATTWMHLLGVNLPEGLDFPFRPRADASPGDTLLRIAAEKGQANALSVRVGDGPEFVEPIPEPADDPVRPTPVTVPGAINGRFAAIDDGDLDFYRLMPAPGREGDYAITVYAARIGSAADPVVAVVDPRGISQAEDDDKLGRDARIERRIDADGLVIAVRDAFHRGGPRFVYRIEVEPIQLRRITAIADLGGRTVPRNGSIAVPIALERQDDDGPATILAGELPPGVSAAPVTIPAKARSGVLVLSASLAAALGPFPVRLVVRDVRGGAVVRYRERGRRRGPPRAGPDGKPEPAEGAVEMDRPQLAVAEPASLGLSVKPDEVTLAPSGNAEIKVRLDRRGEAAKKPVKLRLVAEDGGLDGLDKVSDATVAVDKSEHVFVLKAKPGLSPRRVLFTVQAWFEGGNEAQAVNAPPAALVVP
ncbi:MAG: putative serine proteinase, subtilase family [Planctomycetota bacterium]|nr:putative serine proteinase, subtilase family [Planctomycetota bacterium]